MNKDAYQQKMEAQIAKWRVEMEKLKATADAASADAKIEFDRRIDELRSKQQAAKDKFDDVRNAGEKAWEELKSGVDKAFDDVTNSIKTASEQFRRH